MLMRLCSLILILIAAVGTRLAAQWPSAITSGARVQVRLPEVQYQMAGPRGQLLRGRVTALTPDTLYLSVTDSVGPLPVPRHLIDQIKLSKGVPSRFGNAMRNGLGGAVGFALVSIVLNELNEEPEQKSVGDAALIGAGIGFALGSVTGAIWPTERWKKVRM
jgi:hypothetical protein